MLDLKPDSTIAGSQV